MDEKKLKKMKNTKEEYDKVLASDDPTKVSNQDLQNMAKESVKKFKSLG